MTGKADFTADEWKTVLEGPPTAGLIVLTAQRGGTLREAFAMAKAYAEARQQHGASQLVDEIVSTKPEVDHTRFRSFDELKAHGLQEIRQALALVDQKATQDEAAEYKRFILTLADRVANAHREGDVSVSDAERAAIDEISAVVNPG